MIVIAKQYAIAHLWDFDILSYMYIYRKCKQIQHELELPVFPNVTYIEEQREKSMSAHTIVFFRPNPGQYICTPS